MSENPDSVEVEEEDAEATGDDALAVQTENSVSEDDGDQSDVTQDAHSEDEIAEAVAADVDEGVEDAQ